ncbi:DNA polymerase [Streptomyces sp. NBC_01180]|uniref:DNA polymerase n=1 Tax=Streptomyces sp. NBC_01180 TaxID=2903763 RepID=UPI0038633EED|nr:DNA polymerase [Streptomyces sp. NBC_01180]
MITYPYQIAGDLVAIHVPETSEDLDEFRSWTLSANARGPVAVDTETTGLDIYSANYRLRTVQFGDSHTAWVIHWELGGPFVAAATWALRIATRMQIHNAPFDWCVLDRHSELTIESLAPRTIDTRLKAGLVDPRQPQDGGRGTALKPNAAYYVDPSAPDTQGDLTAVFRSLKLTKETGWAGIPLNHPTYNLYAGLDCILTARLDPKLDAALDGLSVRPRLIQYEHELARICAIMQRKGMLLDMDYTQNLDSRLAEEAARYEAVAERYGVTSINSPAQLQEAFIAMGETLVLSGESAPRYTASGALSMGKDVLLAMADMNRDWKRLGVRKPNPLADAVLHGKRAGKWRKSYAQTFLETVDADGRIHCFINSMQARTARMSITRPALQTLPSGDWMIRRALLAEPGHVMGSCDFSAVEMRVLAALADVKQMKHGFQHADEYPKDEYPDGFDIHMYTARLVKGAGATKAHRKLFKGAGFGKVYGGGYKGVAAQTGAEPEEMRRTFAEYDRMFPEIKRQSNRWQREARETGMVHLSVTGRRLPLDRERAYAVVNYACQSAARDVLGQSLLNIEEAGLLDSLRLPIHDEVVFSAPKGEAEEYARTIQDCMTFDLMGVPITAEADTGGRSWGSLPQYGAPE